MKFLKSYKLFESSDEKVSDEIFNDINDILLEIKDMGITVKSKSGYYYYPEATVKRPAILIDIESNPHDYFYLSRKEGNISDCILRLRDYVNGKGCDMLMLSVPDDNNEDNYQTVSDFIYDYSGEDLTEIQIIIYKK